MNRFFMFLLLLPIFSILAENRTKMVKLTMKQGLIMNQVLSTYALDNVRDPLCKNHTDRFKNGLRAFEPWALKSWVRNGVPKIVTKFGFSVFDSSSKVQSGILLGNLVEFGSFRQCIQIKFEEIRGKHCLIKAKPNLDLIKKVLKFRDISARRFRKVKIIVENAALYWSVCVPASCPENDIFQHFNKNILEVLEGLNLSVSLDQNYCLTEEDNPKMGTAQYLALGLLGSFIGLSLISTIVEWKYSRTKNALIKSFSISTNFQKVMERGNDIDCLHGLRFLSICYVVVGHRYLMAMFFPVINGLEILDWILNYSSTIIIGGTICVDTFLLISGTLVSIGFFEYVTKYGKFNLVLFYLYRYFRITPPLGIVVLIYATLVQYFGSGPLWYDTCKAHLVPCQYYWWSTLLHIQSYVNPHAFCILQTWYLTCDMFYYYFSPIILYPLWKWEIFGLVNLGVMYILSIGISFYVAWVNEYEGGMPVTNQLLQTEYFQKHYVVPHTRAAPYIIGLGFGYYLFKMKDKKIKTGIIINTVGWIICIIFMVSSVVGCRSFQLEDHDYNRLESSLFLSCSRSAWTAGLVWMIWSCVNGYGGIINDFLGCFLFRVLGRISYGIFLLHMILQFFKNAANKMPYYFSNFSAIYDSLADLFLISIISFLFTIFYELPLTSIEGMLLKQGNKNKKVVPN